MLSDLSRVEVEALMAIQALVDSGKEPPYTYGQILLRCAKEYLGQLVPGISNLRSLARKGYIRITSRKQEGMSTYGGSILVWPVEI